MAHGPGAAAALYPHASCRPGDDLASSRGRGRPASTSISYACGSRFTGTPCCRCARPRCWLSRPTGQRPSTAQPRAPTVILPLSATRASPLTGEIPARSPHARSQRPPCDIGMVPVNVPEACRLSTWPLPHDARCEGFRPRLLTMGCSSTGRPRTGCGAGVNAHVKGASPLRSQR